MTVTTMLAEIISRCGEGYENYTARAKAIFNASVRDLIANANANPNAITGLIYTGEYTLPGNAISIPVNTFIEIAGYSTGILRYMDYTSPTGGQATPSQEKAINLRGSIASAVGSAIYFKYQSSDGVDEASCIFPINDVVFEANGIILFTVIGWNDTYVDTGSNMISTMFSPITLESLIRLSSEKLRQEIAS